MRFNEFERDSLINFGKKHGYITEDMSQEEIDKVLEFMPALAGAARGLGTAAKAGIKGVKAAGQAIQKGTKAVGQAVDKVKAGAQKVTQKVAQRATALKGVTGGKASGGMVAKGLDKVGQGSTLPPNLIKAIAPYTQSIQTMMQDPQLFSKFKLLMKQAQAGQAKAQQ